MKISKTKFSIYLRASALATALLSPTGAHSIQPSDLDLKQDLTVAVTRPAKLKLWKKKVDQFIQESLVTLLSKSGQPEFMAVWLAETLEAARSQSEPAYMDKINYLNSKIINYLLESQAHEHEIAGNISARARHAYSVLFTMGACLSYSSACIRDSAIQAVQNRVSYLSPAWHAAERSVLSAVESAALTHASRAAAQSCGYAAHRGNNFPSWSRAVSEFKKHADPLVPENTKKLTRKYLRKCSFAPESAEHGHMAYRSSEKNTLLWLIRLAFSGPGGVDLLNHVYISSFNAFTLSQMSSIFDSSEQWELFRKEFFNELNVSQSIFLRPWIHHLDQTMGFSFEDRQNPTNLTDDTTI